MTLGSLCVEVNTLWRLLLLAVLSVSVITPQPDGNQQKQNCKDDTDGAPRNVYQLRADKSEKNENFEETNCNEKFQSKRLPRVVLRLFTFGINKGIFVVILVYINIIVGVLVFDELGVKGLIGVLVFHKNTSK